MRRRTHPLARFIWIVAIVILIGDLTAIPWSTIGTIAAGSGSQSPLAFIGMFFAETRNALITVTALAGLGAMVDLLDKIRSKAG